MDDIVAKLKSQIGDDVQQIYDHEALFKAAAAEVLRLREALEEICNLPDVDADNRIVIAHAALDGKP